MSDVVIKVEGLSKRFLIDHRKDSQGHITFRDSLTDGTKSLIGSARSFFAGGRAKPSASKEEFWALRDISFEVRRGDVLGVLGRNGAGKSTLLKLLSRITEPTAGRISLRGRVASLLEVGTGFHGELTGRENIFLQGTILGMTKKEIRRNFDAIVEFSEVEKFLDTPVKRYSSGMYVRLAFAVAAHLESEILIVDEVLAVGDAQFQKKCLGKMSDVSSIGRTILFVSHQMNSLAKLCNSALMLSGGRAAGVTSDVDGAIRDYLSADRDNGQDARWSNPSADPHNAYVTVRSMCASQAGRSAPFRNDEPIRIAFEIDIHRSHPTLTMGIAVIAEDGTLLFWSYATDTPESAWPSLEAGKATLQCEIPAHLLNEGSYKIEFVANVPLQGWLYAPGTRGPSIFIGIKDGLSQSPIWSEARPGYLAPIIQWQRVS